MLLLLNYIINFPHFRVPENSFSDYMMCLGTTFCIMLSFYIMLGLPVYSLDLLMIVIVSDFRFYAPILQELMDEES